MLKQPKIRIFGISWVGALNFVILQWFFIRLFYGVNCWGTLKWIYPLTGWWSDYRTLPVLLEGCIMPIGLSQTLEGFVLVRVPLFLTWKEWSMCSRKEEWGTLSLFRDPVRGWSLLWAEHIRCDWTVADNSYFIKTVI